MIDNRMHSLCEWSGYKNYYEIIWDYYLIFNVNKYNYYTFSLIYKRKLSLNVLNISSILTTRKLLTLCLFRRMFKEGKYDWNVRIQ